MTSIKSAPLMLVALAAIGAVTLVPLPARAQDKAAIDKMVQMNKKALDDYDTLEWDAAKKTLLDALMAGKKAGLDNHPVMARTYVHLGAVYLTGFKDRGKALSSFQRALEIDPGIQLSKGIATPDVQGLFAEAQKKGGGRAPAGGGGEEAGASQGKRRRGPIMEDEESKPTVTATVPRSTSKKKRKALGSDDEEPPLPTRVAALDCPAAEETLIDKPVTVRCAVAASLPVDKVFVMYQMPGEDGYVEAEMSKSPKGWLEAKIPKKAVSGTSLKFYFEGRNAQGKPVVANGGPESPNIMLIDRGGVRRGERGGRRHLGQRGGEPSRGPGRLQPAAPARARQQGEARPRYPLRHPQVLDRDRLRDRVRLREGEGPGGAHGPAGYLRTGPGLAGFAHFAPEFGYQLIPIRRFRSPDVPVHPAAVEVQGLRARPAPSRCSRSTRCSPSRKSCGSSPRASWAVARASASSSIRTPTRRPATSATR